MWLSPGNNKSINHSTIKEALLDIAKIGTRRYPRIYDISLWLVLKIKYEEYLDSCVPIMVSCVRCQIDRAHMHTALLYPRINDDQTKIVAMLIIRSRDQISVMGCHGFPHAHSSTDRPSYCNKFIRTKAPSGVPAGAQWLVHSQMACWSISAWRKSCNLIPILALSFVFTTSANHRRNCQVGWPPIIAPSTVREQNLFANNSNKRCISIPMGQRNLWGLRYRVHLVIALVFWWGKCKMNLQQQPNNSIYAR